MFYVWHFHRAFFNDFKTNGFESDECEQETDREGGGEKDSNKDEKMSIVQQNGISSESADLTYPFINNQDNLNCQDWMQIEV